MTDKNDEIKRLNYFTGQFLEAADFQFEQNYHINMRRRLNRLSYSPGVVDDGFNVTINDDKKQITVGSGFAIDIEGRELLIITPQVRAPRDKNGKGFAATDSIFVTLRYKDEKLEGDNRSTEKTRDTEEIYTGYIRITERPEINFSNELPSGSDVGVAIPIAKLQLDAGGNLQPAIDISVRQLANLVAGAGKIGVGIGTVSPKAKLEVANYALDDAPFQSLIRLQAHQKAESSSNVFDESKPSYGIEFYRKWNNTRVNNIQAGIYAWGTENVGSGLAFRTKPSTGSGANLPTRMVITDGGNVGIGTTSPKAKLEVAGTLTAIQNDEALVGLTIAPTFQDSGKTGIKHYGLIVADGNVGIGATDPKSKLTINKKIIHDGGFSTFGDAQLTIFDPNHNGGESPNGTRDMLHLVREGVSGKAYGNKASFALGRYENNGLNSRTQLDIKLTDDSFSTHKAVMTLRSNGNVGIGTDPGPDRLKVNGTLRLQDGVAVRQFSNDITFSGNSDESVPTEKAVKAYVTILENRYKLLEKILGTIVINGTVIELVPISGGSFMMGSSPGESGRNANEDPLRKVYVPSFFMCKYPLTVAQKNALDGSGNSSTPEDNVKVVRYLTWSQANEYSQKLSKFTGRKFRLPSEAEWEYACRADTTTPYFFGETAQDLNQYAASFNTESVGTCKPNPWGLYDFLGLGFQWCEDTWHENYLGAPTDGKAWIVPAIKQHVTRGSFGPNASMGRSASRYSMDDGPRTQGVVCRFVCELT